MPTNIPWDDDTAGQALARAMADTYGLSQKTVLDWYHRAIHAMKSLDQARVAVQGLIEEPSVVATYGYAEQDRDAYHAHYWNMLREAVGLTEIFCTACGRWHPPSKHPCL